jgi:hypothetical protein
MEASLLLRLVLAAVAVAISDYNAVISASNAARASACLVLASVRLVLAAAISASNAVISASNAVAILFEQYL